jgi:hypothetical protein
LEDTKRDKKRIKEIKQWIKEIERGSKRGEESAFALSLFFGEGEDY